MLGIGAFQNGFARSQARNLSDPAALQVMLVKDRYKNGCDRKKCLLSFKQKVACGLLPSRLLFVKQLTKTF